MKTTRVLVAIVFVAAVAVVAASVVVIKQCNRIAAIERRLGSGSIDQVAVQADRDARNRHFSLPSPDNTVRLDGVLSKQDAGFLLGGNVKDAPEGTAYQLWAQTTVGPVSLGVLGDEATDVFSFHLPKGTDRLFITTETPTGAVSPNPATVVVTGSLPAEQ